MNFAMMLIVPLFIFTGSLQARNCKDYLTKDNLFTENKTWWKATKKPLTLAAWSKLSRQAKIEKIDRANELDDIEVGYDQINHPGLRKSINEMAQKVLQEVSRDNIDNDIYEIGYIFAIGEPVLADDWIHLFKIDKNIVAVSIGMYQEGGATMSEKPPNKKYYSSLAEAKADLGKDFDHSDVNWHVASYFELDGQKMKVLTFDAFG